jgi:hypothetical protein
VPLDDFLPDYDANEVHSTRIAAPPDQVLAAARALSPREVPLVVALMAARRLPARLLRLARGRATRPRSSPSESGAPDAPLLDSPSESGALDAPFLEGFTRAGFFVLADRPDELVLGVVGRFWTPDGGIERVAADDFVAFGEPGFAKAVFNFHVREVAGGTLLTTETRIEGTDERARRMFRRYWRVVMPGSALIRRAWLRAIRNRAERR